MQRSDRRIQELQHQRHGIGRPASGAVLCAEDLVEFRPAAAFAHALAEPVALCQRDDLHYLLVNATAERASQRRPLVIEFAKVIQGFGCDKAYALDGGQTATIVMNDQVMNTVSYGAQRKVSDIIYFATALPEDEWE